MYRNQSKSIDFFKKFCKEIEDSGYESILFTFHSETPDYFIKSAAIMQPGDKLKFMIALRPYHVSPQYCAMMTEAFNHISPNRLILNWIAGDQHNRNDETDQLDVYGNAKNLKNVEDRKIFLRDFVDQYLKMPILYSKPEMVFSGFSEYTLETTKMFKSIPLCMLDDYRKLKHLYKDFNRVMVALTLVVLDTDDDVLRYQSMLKEIKDIRKKDFTIVGTELSIIEKIKTLENEGITDILVSSVSLDFSGSENWNGHNPFNENNFQKVNKVIHKITQQKEK
jgi:alkanesulfonate monooxygenase SsuD/methylene tetrahydromethanopterin reductase-like flavin-dependent oxidoreductase (luciferase family)